MNISSTPRRVALAVLTFVCLLVAQNAQAQDCSDFNSAPPSGAVTIILPLDAAGDAQITNAVLNANGFQKDGGCDYWLSLSPGGPYTNTPINFTCNPPLAGSFGGVGTYVMYVRTGGTIGSGGIATLGGPGATIVQITVEVEDNIFPTINTNAGPYNRSADAAPAGSCQYTIMAGDAADFDPIAPAPSDNCLGFTVEYSIDGGTWTAGSSVVGQVLLGAGAHTIQWRNRDASNNITTNTAITVNVTDNTSPMITCPADQNVPTDAGVCTYDYVGADATATDNCGVVSITNNLTGALPLAGYTFNAGVNGAALTTNVTWTASDGLNSMNCVQMITVSDQESPVVTCPAGAPFTRYVTNVNAIPACVYETVAGEFDYIAPTSDNCSLNPVAYQIQTNTLANAVPPSTGPIPVGIQFNTTDAPYTITWTASDAEGNPNDVCSFIVNVLDNTSPDVAFFPFDGSGAIQYPTITGGSTSSYAVTATSCSATVTIEQPNDLYIDLTNNPPFFPYIGPNYLVNDCSGTFSFTGRTITIPPGSSFTPPPPFNPGDPTNRLLTATFPTGVTTITYEISDNNVPANLSYITITVTVTENTPPTAICKDVTLQLDANGAATLNPAAMDDGSSDNCGNVSFSASQTAFDCSHLGTTAVTLTVTDNSNLMATDVCNVTIVDNILPTLTCPLNVTVPTTVGCTGTPSGIAIALGNPTDPGFYDDNCTSITGEYQITRQTPLPVTVIQSFTPGFDAAAYGPLSVGTYRVDYRITDASLNQAVCFFTLTVQDVTGPTCPAAPAVTVTPSAGGCIATATWSFPPPTDPCSNPVTVFSQTHTSGSFFPFGTTPVTYVFKDAAGNASNCTFNVVVVDNTLPVLSCKPSITVDLNASTPAQPTQVTVNAADIINTVSDNSCFFTFSHPTRTYTCANVGVASNYALTVTDNANNSVNCVTTVVVRDVTPPVANCALTVGGPNIINLNASNTVTVFANNLSPVAPDISLNAGSTDNCGIEAYEVSKDGTTFAASVTFGCSDVSTTANPQTRTLTLRVRHKLPIGVTAPGTAGVDYTTCTRTVSIKELNAPTMTIPPNITLDNYCDLANNPLHTGTAPPTGTSTGSATASDVCSGTLSYYPSSSPVPAGGGFTYTDVSVTPVSCPVKKIIDRTWKATDASGNMTVATQRITLRDNTVPNWLGAFATPQNVTLQYTGLNADCLLSNAINVSASNVSDNCTLPANITFKYSIDYEPLSPGVGANPYGFSDIPLTTGTSVSLFPIGVTKVTFFAFDECNNSASANITVTVLDKAKPIINEPFAQTLGNTDNVCGQTFEINNANNNCGNTFTWFRPLAAANDFTDCSAFLANGNGGVTETFTPPAGQGSISVPAFNYNSAANAHPTAFFPVGSTVVTYTATDVAGNTATCSFTVKVLDVQAPVPTCPVNQTLATTCPGDPFPDYRNLVTIADNCGNIVQKTQVPAPTSLVPANTIGSIFGPTPAPGQMITVTMTATDLYPNNLTGTCTFKVTLADGSAPVPTIPGQLTTIESFCGSVTVDAPTATDNAPGCNPVPTIIYGTPSTPVGMLIPGSNPPKYNFIYTPAFGNPSNYVVTWIYNDGNGNQSSQLQNIIVWKDDFPPVALCKPITVDLSSTLNGAATATITPAMVDNGSNDNGPMGCGQTVTLVSVTPNSFGCSNVGPNTVTLTVRDAANPPNTATCTAVVTVRDVTTPVLNGVPANITVESCREAIPAAANVTTSDNCTPPVVPTSVSTQGTTGCSKYSYDITRTWTVTDGGGNVAQASQVIAVRDTRPPIFSPNLANITVSTEGNDANCDAAVTLNISALVTDSCSAANEITITQVYTGPGRVIDASCTTPAVNPACASGLYEAGVHTITFTATDICGNTATKTITVTVNDATIPTAVCINGVSAALQSGGSVTVNTSQFNNNSYDNCGGALDLKIQRLDLMPVAAPSSTLTFTCVEADGVTQRPIKLVVTDAAGNMSMCQTYIVIQDNNPPTITCPANTSVLCTANYSASAQGAGVATATDNCPNTVSVVLPPVDVTTNVAAGGTCFTIARTWTAKDGANNTSTCVQTITVTSNTPPTFDNNPQNATISCSSPLVNAEPLTATDLCGNIFTITPTISSTQTPTGCSQYSYVETRTWTATGSCGNAATHTQVVTVTDVDAPQFTDAPEMDTIFSANHASATNCTVPVVDFDIKDFIFECADDVMTINTVIVPAVAGVTVTNGDLSGNSFPVGSYTITFTATDACSNTSTHTLTLVVVDNTTPEAKCIDLTASLDNTGNVSIDAATIGAASTDNCGIASYELAQEEFDCTDLGLNVVTLTVTDVNGNSNTCESEITVELGATAGFNLTVTGAPESYFGAANGTATAAATAAPGGSNSFTYAWSNLASTASISNLAAGTYTVTVTNTQSGCISVDTAIVQPGPKITLSVGTISGCQGQTVTVPVTVDNFLNVAGFSFGLQLANPAVGTITGLSNPNPTLTGMTFLNSSVSWSSAASVPLNNGSVLFNVNIQLSGTAAVGTTSSITTLVSPALVFVLGTAQPTPASMVVFNAGTATINCATADLQVGGAIKTWQANAAVPGVSVALTGSVTATQTTPAAGTYLFPVPSGSNTLVTPTKAATAFNPGVNVGDLIAIQRHLAPIAPINLQTPFSSPFQWVAADVNGDKSVSIIDYGLINKYILTGTNGKHFTDFQNVQIGPDWKFVPRSFAFAPLPAGNPANPALNPLNNPTPTSNIPHTNVTASFTMDDFAAVRMGDVVGNTAPTDSTAAPEFETGETLKFRLDERTLQAGETVTIPFKASDFTARQAYQMTIAFDPNVLELQDIQPGVLPGLSVDGNFGLTGLADGLLSTLWASTRPETYADNTVLFSLTFKVLDDANGLSGLLHASADLTAALALDEDGNVTPVDFEFVTSSVATGEVEHKTFALYQNQPNPFQAETSIGFRLPEASRATLRVYSATGRLVKTVVGNFAEGNNVLKLRKDELGSNGVFYYELETPKYSDRKKMILID